MIQVLFNDAALIEVFNPKWEKKWEWTVMEILDKNVTVAKNN
jgi:hypothetical protein